MNAKVIEVQMPEAQPLMIEMLSSLKNRIAGIEMTSEAIKTRVGCIDGNIPPIKDVKNATSPTCVYDELSLLLSRLNNIEDVLTDCNNRLTGQLG